MIALIFGLILTAQGIAASPADMGTIDGVIRTSSGEPASGIRVAAIARPDTQAEPASETSSVSLAETDERGHFRLENIPPGSYFIAAGRVALPTYFPGTIEMLKGKAVSVTPNAIVPNINFDMDDASIRPPAAATDLSDVAELTMPVQVRLESGGKQPVFSNGRYVMVRFTRIQDGAISEEPLTDSILNIPVPRSLPGFEYRVTIENLPGGYAVKSINQDGVDLMNDLLKITARNFVQAPITVYGAALPGAMLDTVRMAFGAGAAMTPLEITLASREYDPPTGVRVSGRVTSNGSWDLSLPGSSCILFADRSFECHGVAPGRHAILLQDRLGSPPHNLAASIVVGDKDMENVPVERTDVLPVEVHFPSSTPLPGTIVPLAWIRGRVADDTSKIPVLGGRVTLVGKTTVSYPIDNEGAFEIPGLLPGSYELTIEGFRHAPVRQNVVVGDDDVHLDVSVRSAD
jgi:hypothetical protein